jgi:hypothetical protein
MIRYKHTDGSPHPIAVECAVRGYPNRDADGDIQFENTHFDTLADAWKCVLDNLRAGVRLDSIGVREARRTLEERSDRLVQSAMAWDEADRLHREWQEKQSDTTEAPHAER